MPNCQQRVAAATGPLYFKNAWACRVHAQLPQRLRLLESLSLLWFGKNNKRKKFLQGLQSLKTAQTSPVAVVAHKRQHATPTLAWRYVQKWDSVCLKEGEVVLWRKGSSSNSHGGIAEWVTVSSSCWSIFKVPLRGGKRPELFKLLDIHTSCHVWI